MESSRATILLHPPTYSFFEWRILEASFLEGSPSRHLIGRTEDNIRVSSPIFVIDAVLRSCMTHSRNIYRLVGNPGQGLEAELAELWERWGKTNGVVSVTDVTDDVLGIFRQVDAELGFEDESMPDDFPKDWFLGAVAGTQMKFLARDINGRYVVGPTQDELDERFELCRRLAVQYFRLHLHRSETKPPAVTADQSLPEVFAYDALRAWNLSAGERKWIVNRIESRSR